MNKFNTRGRGDCCKTTGVDSGEKKKFFSALQSSVWSKNKRIGRAGPFSGSATVWSRHVTSRSCVEYSVWGQSSSVV